MRLELSLICKSAAPRYATAIRRAILSGGRTAQARPASRTARGMPQTAQLASSCAITEPPQATSRAAPSTPSRPMPVSTTPSAPAPKTAPTDANIGSTEGMQPLELRPLVKPHHQRARRGSTVRCASPGATRMRSGRSAIPSSATTHSRSRNDAELAREHRHERRRQMLGNEDRNADPLGQRLEKDRRARGSRRSTRRPRGCRSDRVGIARSSGREPGLAAPAAAGAERIA